MEITKIKVNGIVYDIADKEAVEALARQLAAEKQRAEEAERALGNAVASAARVDRNAFTATADEVKLTTTGVDVANQHSVALPAATTEKAGVMSAEDKKKLGEAPNLALRALFIAAGAEYNDTEQIIKKTAPWETEEAWVKNADGTYTYSEVPAVVDHLPKHYYLNGLGDITEEQMMEIYNEKESIPKLFTKGFISQSPSLRTLLPITSVRLYDYSVSALVYYARQCTGLETIFFNTKVKSIANLQELVNIQSGANMFNGDTGLMYVQPINVKDMSQGGGISFQDCVSLKYMSLRNLKVSYSGIKTCPLISKKSVLETISYAAPTSAITITLHPDAYARIANQPDILAALEAQPLVTLVSA